MALNIASFNLRGLRGGLSMLNDLCQNNSIIAFQEHWLRPDELNKLSCVNSEFSFHACSGMSTAVSRGVVSGRPFGGVGFLWNKSFDHCMEFVTNDAEGRCSVFKLKLSNKCILLFNLYLPCANNSCDYRSEISFYAGFISDILQSVIHTDIIIMGDFNFDIDISKCGFLTFQQLVDEFHLSYCDNFIKSSNTFTYVNDALNSRSCIDHFIVSSDIFQRTITVNVIDSNINFSDHRPIVLCLDLVPVIPISLQRASEKKVFKVRWDKCDTRDFYRVSGELLNTIPQLSPVESYNEHNALSHRINIYYDNIVGCLSSAEKLTVPRVPCSALKPFWNEHLDELKQDSLFWHSIWISSDKPTSGIVFQLKRSTSLKYKLAVRQAFALYENRFDDELGLHFLNKRMPEFWKTWSVKFRRNAERDVYIDGSNDGMNVANAFADHFSKVYQKTSANGSGEASIQSLLNTCRNKEYDYSELKDLINVELVDKCIQRLKLGKACGPDDLSAEHLLNAHPIVVMQLCELFRLLLYSGCVPDGFGKGTIIPLLKDKTGDANSLDNYRGITLIPVIAKLFELVILEVSGNCFETDDLQFGFKSDVGCPNAIFTLRSTIDYFKNKGSTVYGASLDISKAYDTVNHYKLFVALSKTGMCKNILALMVNWYSKLSVAVRWKGFMSSCFYVGSGVRQGSSLSPTIFNVFMNMFIVRLKALRCGCCIGGYFVGCILYADDIILLSASVDGLQRMLNCCFEVSSDQLLSFNCTKSSCFKIGKLRPNLYIKDMHLGCNTITWCESFKYLGLCFNAGNSLRINIDVIKHKFFAACNSVLSNSRSLDELIQLQLQESFCLPLLQYGVSAIKLTSSQCSDLNSCWNTVFRRIFHFRKFDSVRLCICGLGRLDFYHIRLNLVLKFVKKCLMSSNVIIRFLSRLFTLSKEFKRDCDVIGLKNHAIERISFYTMRSSVYSHFNGLCC